MTTSAGGYLGGSDDCPATTALPAGIELVQLHRVSPALGFAAVRLPGVLLSGLRVELRRDGSLSVSAPVRTDRNGRPWPIYSIQPGWREAVEAAIGNLWGNAPA